VAIGDSQVALPAAGAARALPAAGAPGVRRGWLFHPLVDFLCLGGGSLLALALLLFVLPPDEGRYTAVFAWALLAAHVVNHPHFANSYQIFYAGFFGKAFGDRFAPPLRRRYLLAGVVVPLALIAFLAGATLAGDARLLGMAGNAMLFLVGWHYAKQGYGMAMLDAALKRRFFGDGEKRILLWNAYACWLLSWLLANRVVAAFDLWGLAYWAFGVPDWLMLAAWIAAGAGALAVVLMLLRKGLASRGRLAWNGLIAYGTALYAWLVFVTIDPVFLLIVPAFHSLQYLVVVWRYQLNRNAARPDAGLRPRALGGRLPRRATLRLLLFLVAGVAIGWLGFWGLPEWLGARVDYDKVTFGPALFLFHFWIFINVHHYFLDSVMWRRENPETRRHLFG